MRMDASANVRTRRARRRICEGARSRMPHAAAVLSLLLSILVCAALPSAASADEASEGGEALTETVVTLKPDGYFTATYATTDTVVLINQPGTYLINGRSDKVRVVIQAGPGDTVNLYLGNGLALSPRKGHAAAITVAPQYDATGQPNVSLVMLYGANVSLAGGNGSPAILLMQPDDPTAVPPSPDPVLTVKAQDSRGALELRGGSAPAVRGAGFGTIEFESGHITATGESGMPAVANYGEIIVSGGELSATGGAGAPGIGSTTTSAAVSVTGGVVRAAGGTGAPAIGSVEGSATVAISGGILSLENGSLDKAPLVGSVNGDAAVSFAGGITLGSGEYGQLAIGSKAGSAEVAISGGTVEVGLSACGTGKDGKAQVTITGGSYTGVTAGTGASAFTAINRAGVTVHRVFVGLEEAGAGVPVTSLEVYGTSSAYGTNDLIASQVHGHQQSRRAENPLRG